MFWESARHFYLPLVLLHKVEVVPADDDGPVHLGTVASSSNDSAPDGNSPSEWALLVNVGTWKRIDINRLSNMTKQNNLQRIY